MQRQQRAHDLHSIGAAIHEVAVENVLVRAAGQSAGLQDVQQVRQLTCIENVLRVVNNMGDKRVHAEQKCCIVGSIHTNDTNSTHKHIQTNKMQFTYHANHPR